jgi:hypothetical protein
MARPEDLFPGNCYFLLHFCDRDLLLPDVSTLTYVRSEEDPEHGRTWLFEEPPGDPPDDEREAEPNDALPSLFKFKDDELYQVLDIAGLIKALGEVAPDHPIHPVPAPTLPPSTLDHLRSQIAQFLEDSQYKRLTAKILFTADAIILGRREGRLEMSVFLSPRTEPRQEARLRALLDSKGVKPHVDYLANRGRTRILEFPIPNSLDALHTLCSQILTEVFAMRENDFLKYSFRQ